MKTKIQLPDTLQPAAKFFINNFRNKQIIKPQAKAFAALYSTKTLEILMYYGIDGK